MKFVIQDTLQDTFLLISKIEDDVEFRFLRFIDEVKEYQPTPSAKVGLSNFLITYFLGVAYPHES